MDNSIYVVKATGEREPFMPQKLKNSLGRAGASEAVIEKIVSHIEAELREGASTKEIYHHAFELLKREEAPRAAAKYSLKRAIMELGPTGFPFEKFVAEIFRTKGFETTTDYIAHGECADHEIDIVAWNENKLIMVEAKFHNEIGLKSDLKVALYVKARWDDLLNQEFDFGKKRKLDEGWLVTNTKFSEAAIQYAKCRDMKVIDWNYPAEGSLQDLIEDAGLHPITCLTSINQSEERELMALGIVLCKQALDNPDIVAQAIPDKQKLSKMLEEIASIQK